MSRLLCYVTVYFFAVSLCCASLKAQELPAAFKNYFSSPLKIPLQLSGNFGELRKEHFHMGIDLRTHQKENLPVYAAADGYVSKIKIEQFGYGRAIYIKHNNGYTTVYAHLNNFYTTLHQYVKNKQYAEQKWEQDFELEPGLFTIKKGDFIAFSGNTGGSQGPHLHFEIRNENDENINPLLFNLPITDTKPPLIYNLYYYERASSIYTTKPIEIKLKQSATGLQVVDSIIYINNSAVGFGITAEDITNTSNFKFGIYAAAVYVDGKLLSKWKLQKLKYTDARYINACKDYSYHYIHNKKIQFLFKLPGNQLNIFEQLENNGFLLLEDTLPKKIDIVIYDVQGNNTPISFYIRRSDVPNNNIVFDNRLLPNVPSSTQLGNYTYNFTANTFYDTVPLLPLVTINNNGLLPQIPVHNLYTLKTPINSWQLIHDTKLFLQIKNNWFNNTFSVVKHKDSLVARANYVGFNEIIIDTLPPMIELNTNLHKLNGFSKYIQCKVYDNETKIKTCNAYLNGKWILMSRKDNFFIYEIDEHCIEGKNLLQITATDMANNEQQSEFEFIYTKKVINKKAPKTLKRKNKR
jgi:hypothetical protein